MVIFALYVALWVVVNAITTVICCVPTVGILWALWAVITAGIMLVDRILSGESCDAAASTCFALAPVAPFMVLPVYFFSSHRRAATASRLGVTIASVPLTCVAFMFACCQFVAVANMLYRACT